MKKKDLDIDKILKIISIFRSNGRKSVHSVEIIEKYTESPYKSEPSFNNAYFAKEGLSNHSPYLGIEKAWDKSSRIIFTNSAGVSMSVTTMLWNI